ncbi:MAG: TetR family transcriptional regulator [Spirochaetia bacterium]|nr:TetR family transcriptional regulator [Spirochaetia bacterium]
MPRTGLTSLELKENALDQAEILIRRHGFEKTHLVDIAKALNVSHPVLYRLFPDKIALLDAVSERWLSRMDAELEAIAKGKGKPLAKLEKWFLTLHRLKKEKVGHDPELYRAFSSSAEAKRPVVAAHLKHTRENVLHMVQEAIAEKSFKKGDPEAIARMLSEITISFHHPRLVLDRLKEKREEALKAALRVLFKGLA